MYVFYKEKNFWGSFYIEGKSPFWYLDHTWTLFVNFTKSENRKKNIKIRH
jgi:hypothetical protein